MSEIGDIMNVQLIVEGSMNSSNPYYSSSWRRNFTVCFLAELSLLHFVPMKGLSKKMENFLIFEVVWFI